MSYNIEKEYIFIKWELTCEFSLNVIMCNVTQEYLKKHTKACPNCASMAEKIDGCNKMTWNYCQACFCWLCGILITTKNPYDHFLSGGENCYQRLFV